MTDPMIPPAVPGVDVATLAHAALPDGISPFVVSQIRTAVPLAAGAALTWAEHELARRYGWAPTVDSSTVTAAATFAVSYGYYFVVRSLEKWKPALGWALGYPSQPTY